jgi:capsular exopolysaccharide synthesis family protein
LVTSSTPKEGKTVVAANLAVTLACSSAHVLLLDADMRGPGSGALYGLENSLGLADILERRATLAETTVYLEELKVHYIPSGKPSSSPADLVKSARMKELFEEVAGFDWVVVDSPPIGTFADGLSLAPQVDAVLLVARSGMTSKRDLEESLAALKDSKIAAVVLNAHDQQRKRDSYYSYYSKGERQL